MMKSKKLLILVALLLLMIWSIKGYWTSGVKDRTNEIQITPLKAAELAKFNEVTKQLKRHTLSCIKEASETKGLPTIYAITPTHTRPVQKAELTRLSHTLMLVPNLHWIIIEDSETKTDLVSHLLEGTGLPYTHLNAATPKTWKLKAKEPRWVKPRGVLQRNSALEWVRNNISPDDGDGVIYFVDDDNSYALEVFDEMRYIKGVGVWPVGLVGGLMVERPRLNSQGKVDGWLTVWSPNRPFAIDMAGFAINLQLFLSKPDGKFSFESEKGYQESELLKHFVSSLDQLEVKADNCTKVYVWHTRTEAANLRQEDVLRKSGKPRSDVGIEV